MKEEEYRRRFLRLVDTLQSAINQLLFINTQAQADGKYKGILREHEKLIRYIIKQVQDTLTVI